MGRKQISVPTLIPKPGLPGDWWEGVRGRGKYMGDKIPKRFQDVSRRSEQLGRRSRRSDQLERSEPEVCVERKMSELSLESQYSQV